MMRTGRLFKKFISLILIIIGISATVKVYAQQITIREVNAPLEKVFKEIQQQTGYSFVYTTETLKKANTVNVDFDNTLLNEALKQLFSGQPLGYTVYNKLIIVKEKEIVQIKDKVIAIGNTQQPYSISGTVNDEKGQPVPGATVFLTNTKAAIAAGNNGNFTLNGIAPGAYEMVVKMIGFEPGIQQIRLTDGPLVVNVRLKEANIQLGAVIIKGKDPFRARRLSIFLENFIGQTVNAEDCKLLNPDVVSFHLDTATNILHATANDFLIVENKALGYSIKYLLTDFQFNWNNHFCTIGGSPYFEELKGSANQQKKWEENRRLAYLSSARHFFKDFIEDRLKEDGFEVYLMTYVANNPAIKYNDGVTVTKAFVRDSIREWTPTQVKLKGHYETTLEFNNKGGKNYRGLTADYGNDKMKLQIALPFEKAAPLFITGNNNYKMVIAYRKITGKDTVNGKDTISLKNIYVIYNRQKQSALFYKTGVPVDMMKVLDYKRSSEQMKNRQISMIEPLADTVISDRNGAVKPLMGFRYKGYWAWQRIADLTPLEYFVDPLAEKKE